MGLRLKLRACGESRIGNDPVEELARLVGGVEGDVVMLHSGAGVGQSVVGWEALCKVVVDVDGRVRVMGELSAVEGIDGLGVLEALELIVKAVEVEGAPALVGWMGFVSYDIGGVLEEVPRVAGEELRWPLAGFVLFRRYAVWDGAMGQATEYVVLHEGEEAGAFDWGSLSDAGGAGGVPSARVVERQERGAYLEKVRRVREYIAAGDIYQANLAQRWVVETGEAPVEIFRRLCAASPAPYGAFVRFTDAEGMVRHAISASPELFLAVEEGRVLTRPIKGTRPRDVGNVERDEALREELLASVKDQAELAMIVDLLRNDVGRVARFGSVRVAEPRAIEQHPTVWHTVATIEAELREGAGLAEVLRAVCPGGSITGAPKIRAMQIIEELEGFRRGLYCGNIGVIGSGGRSMALSIAIRTILMQGGKAFVYAGGGIVADSEPEREFEETLHKAAAMMRALGVGEF